MPYRIFQEGAQAKKIALSFDDGPDPRNTPQILDILKEKHAPATFFVIGVEATTRWICCGANMTKATKSEITPIRIRRSRQVFRPRRSNWN